ncbi:hypothetical protein T09_9775 [Trichinella sp. T9]|nr:hypothetical protein T09_9775 [Trichinella sp. T9]
MDLNRRDDRSCGKICCQCAHRHTGSRSTIKVSTGGKNEVVVSVE